MMRVGSFRIYGAGYTVTTQMKTQVYNTRLYPIGMHPDDCPDGNPDDNPMTTQVASPDDNHI
jgi:hypothetical protein